MGFDMDGNQLWAKTLCSNAYRRTVCDNTPGFVMGQNIVTWVNCIDGGIYGQNIGPDGTMGPIEPPVLTCYPPEDFEGIYIYNMDEQMLGVKLSWTAPETQPLHYNLYRTGVINKEEDIIEVPGDAIYYFDNCGLGEFRYQLTAVYENCESEFALTPDGENYVFIVVTGMEEDTNEEIVNLKRIYTMNGQLIQSTNTKELSPGVYILQGLTQTGKLVTRKLVVNSKL